MEPKKNEALNHLYIVGLLAIVLILIQILGYLDYDISQPYRIVLNVVLEFLGPITFLSLVFLLRNEERPYMSTFNKLIFIIFIIALDILISLALAIYMEQFIGPVNPNPFVVKDGLELIKDLGRLAWQLAGEEGIRISMFFMVYGRLKYDKNKRIKYWLSWTIAACLFGLLHLQTYGYNVAHCIIVIGLPSIIYGYVWKKTESPLTMFLVHYIYDLAVILIALN